MLIVRHWLLKMFIKEEDTHLFANENDAIVSPLDGRVEEMIPVSSNTRSAHSLLLLSQSNRRERDTQTHLARPQMTNGTITLPQSTIQFNPWIAKHC